MKVFCIGLPRTGTTTFQTMMKNLGYRHCGHKSDLNKFTGKDSIHNIFNFIDRNNFSSFDDHPWCDIWKDLSDHYKDAKFVNLVRDPIEWRRSLIKLASKWNNPYPKPWKLKTISDYLKDPNGEDFIKRNQEVKNWFKNKRNFIELDWRYHGYKQLCKFLNLPNTNKPLPCANIAPQLNEKGLKIILNHFTDDEKNQVLNFMGINDK